MYHLPSTLALSVLLLASACSSSTPGAATNPATTGNGDGASGHEAGAGSGASSGGVTSGGGGASGSAGASWSAAASGSGGAPTGNSGNASDAGGTSGASGIDAAVDGAAISPWPAVNDYSARGPLMTQRDTNTGPGAAYDIFRPATLGPTPRKNPIISWANGTLFGVDQYQKLLDHWASHGFVVIAAHSQSTAGGGAPP